MQFHSTANLDHKVSFKEAFLNPIPPCGGLYTFPRDLALPVFKRLQASTYASTAFQMLRNFVCPDIPEDKLEKITNDAYPEEYAPTLQQAGSRAVLWLTKGPTCAFKDYAMRFFASTLEYFLEQDKRSTTVLVATSGDTGGAAASSLHNKERVRSIIFMPENGVSDGQRRQMTTPQGNIYAFTVKGGFSVCQDVAKALLSDKEFAISVSGDPNHFTSANSLGIGRLLPQAVYPAYAFKKHDMHLTLVSIPCGNFGNLMGTLLARKCGMPVWNIICGVNKNSPFRQFYFDNVYSVRNYKRTPSSAMDVTDPANMARLFSLYGGCAKNRNSLILSLRLKMLDDMWPAEISDIEHYFAMRACHREHGMILDPHGAAAWCAADKYFTNHENCHSSTPVIVYETADPAKFPDEVRKALGFTAPVPERMAKQESLPERIYRIESEPGDSCMSPEQLAEAKEKIRDILKAA